MNFKMILNILGWILIFEALFFLVPIITAVVYGEAVLADFLISAGLCLICGGLLIMKKPENKALYSREGYVIVSLSWIVLSLFRALPFYISGVIPNFVDALFETVSGFTTTGATVLGEVETLPKAILIWRSFTHWVGGMGVLVFIMAFVPLSGGQNMHIMKAESPGPSVSKLVPRVKTTAMILYSIYFVLTFAEFIVLLIGGMRVFDALNTSFSTAGTGGFGFRNDSFASFSPALQIIVTVFMLIFSINFSSYYLLITGKLKEVFNSELKVFALIVISAITVITMNIRHLFPSVGDALRNASFTVASIVSTTGFSTADFDAYRREQAEWFAELIKNEDFKKAPVKIIIVHVPPAWGAWHGSLHFRKLFMPLINESGADVILSGHLHSFNPKQNSLPLYPADKDGINVPNVVNSNVDLMIVSANSKEIDISFIDTKGGKPRGDIKLPVGD